MSMSVGTSSSALSYLQSLMQQGTAGVSGAANGSDPLSILLQSLSGSGPTTDPLTSATAPAGATAGSPSIGATTMAALISLQGQSASGVAALSPSQLFAKLDANGDGQISKSEFESALGSAGVDSSTADTLFSKLDANGDGSISQSELTSAKPGNGHHHHMHGGGGSQGSGSSGQSAVNSLVSSATVDGATTQTATNPDGSTTTILTYPDGSTVETTSAVAPTNGGAASGSGTSNGTSNQNSANLLEQLIQLQSQLVTAAGSTLSAIA